MMMRDNFLTIYSVSWLFNYVYRLFFFSLALFPFIPGNIIMFSWFFFCCKCHRISDNCWIYIFPFIAWVVIVHQFHAASHSYFVLQNWLKRTYAKHVYLIKNLLFFHSQFLFLTNNVIEEQYNRTLTLQCLQQCSYRTICIVYKLWTPNLTYILFCREVFDVI